MAYADFDFYIYPYFGAAIPADVFPRVAERASERIDAATYGRAALSIAAAEPGTADAIRRCCCAVAELVYASEQTANGAGVVKAEAVGTWRKEYAPTAEDAQTLNQRAQGTINRYLAGWGLLNRGVPHV